MGWVTNAMGIGIYVPDADTAATTDDAAARAAAAAAQRGDNTAAQSWDAQAAEMRRLEALKNGQASTGPVTDDTPPGDDPYTKYLKEEQARLERLRVMNANAMMTSQMEAFGLGSLASQIMGWITEGYEADAIMAKVRQTQEYADRFPAMKALQQKGRSISESEYIAYEQTMAQYERMFGFPPGMLSSKDQVTKSLTNELSAEEVRDRAVRASASMYQLPQEFKDTMQRYYGIDSGGLAAYMLDPDVANPLLERQYVASQIGMEATLKGITVDKAMSEALYEGGVDRAKASQGFQNVAYTSEFGAGRGDTADQGQRIGSFLQDSPDASKAVQRAGEAREQRFKGGSGQKSDKSGVSSLGSSST